MGGDEFFALMRNAQDVRAIENKAKHLLASIQRVCREYQDVHLSCSIGVAVYPKDGDCLEALYAKADDALYQAKNEGKNKYVMAK